MEGNEPSRAMQLFTTMKNPIVSTAIAELIENPDTKAIRLLIHDVQGAAKQASTFGASALVKIADRLESAYIYNNRIYWLKQAHRAAVEAEAFLA